MVFPMKGSKTKQLYYGAIVHVVKGFTSKKECFSAGSVGIETVLLITAVSTQSF